MSLEERAKAVAKNVEGKVQEALSDITGDPKDKVEGQAKQDQAAAIHTKEDIKDKAKDIVDKSF
ncbi:MAG: CsbD family protein [Chroococcidiopsidaceae cyanobacterium CP_BM_ER_R8_30]|nr:CsbD family protein [Chroococcidiopsidaceae cyanobacterium CP_BM_ER_R8_30]